MTDDRGDLVAFDEHGDGVGRYNIMNFRQRDHSGTYDYFRVGHWANGLRCGDLFVRSTILSIMAQNENAKFRPASLTWTSHLAVLGVFVSNFIL